MYEPPGPKPEAAVAPPIPTSGGSPLPKPLQQRLAPVIGTDLSSVRVHQGPAAGQLGAVAFTRGDHIHFSPGSYAPSTASGASLLGHELAHVAQQRAGRVPATTQVRGVPVNANKSLESEADRVGAAAARATFASVPIRPLTSSEDAP